MSKKALEDLKKAAAVVRAEIDGPGKDGESEDDEESIVDETSTEEEEEEDEEDSPEEEEDEETSAKGDETSEDEEESEDESEDEGTRQPRGNIQNRYNTMRSQKREAEAIAKSKTQEAETMKSQLDTVTAELESLKKNRPPSQAFLDAAKEMGIEDPESLEKLASVMKTEISKEYEGKFKNIEERNKSQDEALAPILSQVQINKEWEETMLPVIEDEYPHATGKQLIKARSLMKDLVETDETYNKKDMDYVFYKERQQFAAIFGSKPRQTSFRSGGGPVDVETNDDKRLIPRADGTREGISKMKKALDKIKSGDNFREGDNDRM